ncbi:MAG: hypothetical protein VB049_05815 [Candidatus Pelethousia sp.]|nr:hypothetical protein [Candidatus Pelethousia sp.]
MQRIAPNTLPPRGGNGSRQGGTSGQGESPAFRMANRIRSEQGADRAAQYLNAMEPFLAPAERAHIAEQLGLRISVPQPQAQPAPPPPPPPPSGQGSMPNMGTMPGVGAMPGLGGASMPNMGPLGNIGNIMQMMQLFQGLSSGGQGGGIGGGNPMQFAQMLGNLMGGKKNP